MATQDYDVIVVGAGMAGLTSACTLVSQKKRVLLLEKGKHLGGMIGTFIMDGFAFDRGARSIESSGIVIPMLHFFDIPIEFVHSPVKRALNKESVTLTEFQDIETYRQMLHRLFPKEKESIDCILKEIYQVMDHMDVLYGMDNPLFMKYPPDPQYLKQLFPWMFKFLSHIKKAMKLMTPIEQFLRERTSNSALADMISQHFFKGTPSFFALSYFSLYLDYQYPKGGTGTIPDSMGHYFINHQGELSFETEIRSINLEKKLVIDQTGKSYSYQQLIWTADTNHLYQAIDLGVIQQEQLVQTIQKKKEFLANKKGAESVLTLYLGSTLPPSHFAPITGPHAFYTPFIEGLSKISMDEIKLEDGSFVEDWPRIQRWLQRFIKYNTFEISIPALRDPSLAPKGKTGLIISLLFDYDLVQHLYRRGYYEELKSLVQSTILTLFDQEYIHGLQESITMSFVATPLTIERTTNNTEGSLSGWSFQNVHFPAEFRFTKVKKAVETELPNVFQAGQWTFNPAGVPVAVLTGRIAAMRVIKQLKKKQRGE